MQYFHKFFQSSQTKLSAVSEMCVVFFFETLEKHLVYLNTTTTEKQTEKEKRNGDVCVLLADRFRLFSSRSAASSPYSICLRIFRRSATWRLLRFRAPLIRQRRRYVRLRIRREESLRLSMGRAQIKKVYFLQDFKVNVLVQKPRTPVLTDIYPQTSVFFVRLSQPRTLFAS